VLGYDTDALRGSDVGALIHPADRVLFVTTLTDVAARRGSTATVRARWMQHSGGVVSGDTVVNNLLDDPHVGGIVLNTRDVSAEMTLQAELRRQAFHDPLTQLANRALFEDRVDHALARSDRQERTFAVMFLDIDDFKKVNDSLGHHAGDELLVGLSERLGRAVRASDTVARLGGDEFGILLEDIEGVEDAVRVVEAIHTELAVPVEVQGRMIAPQASIGIALRRPHQADTQDVLRDADLAMYAAKAHGKGGHRVFHDGMRAPVLDRLQMEEDLSAGLASGAFFAEYQPIVRLADGVICGAEALARWHHPTRGLMLPMQFIPTAEETGHIVAIGRHILRTALRACHDWSAIRPGVGVSVNFSARQFQETALVADIEAALRDAEVAPDLLTVEITESILMQDILVSSAKLAELRALGVHISIDDFGTGYSSLSYLHRFPATSLKIDRSFVDLIGGELHDSALPRAIIAMAKSMGLVTVAEGIERRDQLNGLRMLGCDLGQGFYFARPQAAEGIWDILARMPSGPPAVANVA
jgi:diguanylate cyclase (GGDEF)-like protein